MSPPLALYSFGAYGFTHWAITTAESGILTSDAGEHVDLYKS